MKENFSTHRPNRCSFFLPVVALLVLCLNPPFSIAQTSGTSTITGTVVAVPIPVAVVAIAEAVVAVSFPEAVVPVAKQLGDAGAQARSVLAAPRHQLVERFACAGPFGDQAGLVTTEEIESLVAELDVR